MSHYHERYLVPKTVDVDMGTEQNMTKEMARYMQCQNLLQEYQNIRGSIDELFLRDCAQRAFTFCLAMNSDLIEETFSEAGLKLTEMGIMTSTRMKVNIMTSYYDWVDEDDKDEIRRRITGDLAFLNQEFLVEWKRLVGEYNKDKVSHADMDEMRSNVDQNAGLFVMPQAILESIEEQGYRLDNSEALNIVPSRFIEEGIQFTATNEEEGTTCDITISPEGTILSHVSDPEGDSRECKKKSKALSLAIGKKVNDMAQQLGLLFETELQRSGAGDGKSKKKGKFIDPNGGSSAVLAQPKELKLNN